MTQADGASAQTPLGEIGLTSEPRPQGEIGLTSSPVSSASGQDVVCDVTISIRVTIPAGASASVRSFSPQGEIGPTSSQTKPTIDPAGEFRSLGSTDQQS
jgi:hypothetical protein